MTTATNTQTIKEGVKNTLLDILPIDCVYPNESEILNYIKNRFKKEGVYFEEDSFGNIIAKIPGKGDPLLMSTHVDIPEPIPHLGYIIEEDVIRSDGNGILGVDPKSGLAVLIEFLCNLSKEGLNETHAPVEGVLTRGEEGGLHGAKNLDYSMVKSKMGLVLDEDGPVTHVVNRAPACVYIDAEFTGKVAHPREPEKANNALQAISEAVMALPWGFTEKEGATTWNIGTLNAGTARNSVPGFAELKGELRNYDAEIVTKEAEKIKHVLNETAAKHRVDCNVKIDIEDKGYKLNKNSDLVKRMEAIYEKTNLKPNYYSTFGRSDANVFNSEGIATAAIGSAYYNAHQYTEYANLKEMADIYHFLREFVRIT